MLFSYLGEGRELESLFPVTLSRERKSAGGAVKVPRVGYLIQ
jgi:hypothetical protein